MMDCNSTNKYQQHTSLLILACGFLTKLEAGGTQQLSMVRQLSGIFVQQTGFMGGLKCSIFFKRGIIKTNPNPPPPKIKK